MNISKATTSASGIKWLRRATTLARSLKGQSASRRELVDGFIIEARKSGGLRSARVMDIPGRIALMGPNAVTGRAGDMVPCGDRDAYSPNIPLIAPTLREPEALDRQALLWGLPVAPDATTLSYGSAHGGARAVYRADVVATDTDSWLVARSAPAGARDMIRSVIIHESVLVQLAPGMQHVARNRLGTARTQEPIPAVAERGTDIFLATNMFKLDSTPTGAGVQHTAQAALLLVRVDAVEKELSGRLIPWADFPAALRPGTVRVMTGGVLSAAFPAQNRLVVTDSTVDAEGSLLVAFEYAVQVQDGDGISWVSAAGRAGWHADGSTSVDLFDVEVIAPRTSSLLGSFGVSADVIRATAIPSLIPGGGLLNTAIIYHRKGGGTDDSPGFDPAPPYSVETVDGIQVADASDGFGSAGGMSLPSSAHIIGVGFTSAQVSSAATACRRADPSATADPDRIGVLFTDGARFRYEALAPADGTSSLHISCPQQELRDADDNLACPSTVIASFLLDGVQHVGIRKGPIWDEDGWDAEAEYWIVVPAPPSGLLQAAFYIGNPAMTRRHGFFFAGAPDD